MWNSLLRLIGVALWALMQIKKSMSGNYMVSTVYATWKICFGAHSEFLIPLQKYFWIHSFLLSKVDYFDLHIFISLIFRSVQSDWEVCHKGAFMCNLVNLSFTQQSMLFSPSAPWHKTVNGNNHGIQELKVGNVQ